MSPRRAGLPSTRASATSIAIPLLRQDSPGPRLPAAGRYDRFELRRTASRRWTRRSPKERLHPPRVAPRQLRGAAGVRTREGVPPINILLYLDNAGKPTRGCAACPELETRVIPLGRPDALLRVHECLERGEIVGMLGDRRSWRSETCRCDFLGGGQLSARPAAARGDGAGAGGPVLRLYLGGRRYDIHLEPFADAIPLGRHREESCGPGSSATRRAWSTAAATPRTTGSTSMTTGVRSALAAVVLGASGAPKRMGRAKR